MFMLLSIVLVLLDINNKVDTVVIGTRSKDCCNVLTIVSEPCNDCVHSSTITINSKGIYTDFRNRKF